VLKRASRVVLRFWLNFELIKFGQNFGETFGKIFGNMLGKFRPRPPTPQKKKREKFYTLRCAYFTFLPKFSVMFSQKLGQHLTRPGWNFYAKVSSKKFQTFLPKFSGNFRVKFWRKFRSRNTTPARLLNGAYRRLPRVKY